MQERFPRQCAQCLGAEAASSENKKRYDGNQAYGAIQEKAYGYNRSDDLKAISKFKDLTPPRFSDVVSHQDDVSEEWSQVDYLSGPTLQVLRTHQSPDGCEGGSYYYLVDMQEKTVQPLMNALCIADNIKLEYQEVTDPYTKERYFEYAHDGKLMGRLLIPSNPENQE